MRVAIVNDMPLAVEALRRLIINESGYQLAWVATDGFEAVSLCRQDAPDILLMDMLMPNMNGVDAIKEIMRQSPCAILVVTATMDSHAGMVFEAMGAGALDAVATPVLGGDDGDAGRAEFIKKLNTIARMIKATRKLNGLSSDNKKTAPHNPGTLSGNKLIAIGSSTGGPSVLSQILMELPPNLDASVVVIQHVDKAFARALASWLQGQTRLPVALARKGERPQRGTVYLAETNDHLVLDGRGGFDYTSEPKTMPYRPSVDVFFKSVAQHWHGPAVAVLLTGMGRDGAQGMLALKQKGVLTIAQNQASCSVYGMPKAAVDLHAATEVLSPSQIARRLVQQVGATT